MGVAYWEERQRDLWSGALVAPKASLRLFVGFGLLGLGFSSGRLYLDGHSLGRIGALTVVGMREFQAYTHGSCIAVAGSLTQPFRIALALCVAGVHDTLRRCCTVLAGTVGTNAVTSIHR